MNILLTGGSGLIGTALTHALVDQDHKVVVLTRDPQKTATRLPASVVVQRWNARDPEGWGYLVSESDAIIHLAGASIAGDGLVNIVARRWSPAYKERILKSRTESGLALVRAIGAAERKPQVFLQASAVGYYGSRDMEEVTEAEPPGDDYLAQVCYQWEASTTEVEAMGVRRIVLRTGLVLAPAGGILPLMLLPFRLFVGGKLGSGRQGISWIHLDDEVGSILFLLNSLEARGFYNLTAPQPVTNAEFARIAGKVLKRPSIFSVPSFILQLALGEKAGLVLAGQRVVPAHLVEDGYTFKYPELEKALSQLVHS